jgi:hypothetical protein
MCVLSKLTIAADVSPIRLGGKRRPSAIKLHSVDCGNETAWSLVSYATSHTFFDFELETKSYHNQNQSPERTRRNKKL